MYKFLDLFHAVVKNFMGETKLFLQTDRQTEGLGETNLPLNSVCHGIISQTELTRQILLV